MRVSEFPMRGLGDLRLALHASSSLPAWLWSADGLRILWTNPVGARVFRADSAAELATRNFGPADPHRRQVAQLAARLVPDAAPRLERLRGFGAPLGRLVTCGCTNLVLADGTEGVLIAAAEPVGRAMPLNERLQRLVEGADIPLAAFGRDGIFVGASPAARALLGFRDLAEVGLDSARERALKEGRAEWPVGVSQIVLQRVGSGADVGLIALLEPGMALQSTASAVTGAAPSQEKDDFGEENEDDFSFPESDDDQARESDAPNDWSLDQAYAQQSAAPEDAAPDDSPPRTLPLRFMWDIDASEHFILRSDELARLIGPQAAATLNAPWQDVAMAHASYGRMAAALASREAWSGVLLELPTDTGGEPLVADLSGIPAYENGEFAGYRGFGLVRDLEGLTDLERRRRRETELPRTPRSLSAHSPAAPRVDFMPPAEQEPAEPTGEQPETVAADNPGPIVDMPSNVVLFSAAADGSSPALTPVENNAFNELARELSARLEAEPATEDERASDAVSLKPGAQIEPDAVNADDLGAILDASSEAILMFGAHGVILACNRSAAKLFGTSGDALLRREIATLFSPDTQTGVTALLGRVATASGEQTIDAAASGNDGIQLPLKLKMGRVRPDGSNFYAIVRDVSPLQASEAALADARREAERAVTDKADILARISHELRSPLNAIIGFADVMIEQRFGPLGNDRYADYLRDIRSCGERVVAIVDDLLDLSRIETGKRDLTPAPQDLNDLVEQCVAAMQPQANRERIIIRSSLVHPLPSVVADGPALRQIALNLIGNSIQLANAGGQVIVSTVHADSGDVLLRVRDTGHGLNDNEMASAVAPFRAAADSDGPAQIRLSLTRALAEANHARFSVRPAPYAGTMIEVAFSPAGA